MAKKVIYSEPLDYFPKDIRKKAGIGEFNKEYWDAEEKAEKAAKKEATKEEVDRYIRGK